MLRFICNLNLMDGGVMEYDDYRKFVLANCEGKKIFMIFIMTEVKTYSEEKDNKNNNKMKRGGKIL